VDAEQVETQSHAAQNVDMVKAKVEKESNCTSDYARVQKVASCCLEVRDTTR